MAPYDSTLKELFQKIERRFGTLPEWAARRLESVNNTPPETWSLWVLEAASVEEALEG